jgi:hypothetical protein
LPLREHAFAQLCARLNVPAAYISRLPSKLALANLNCALRRAPQAALLRLAKGEVRAALSLRYTPVDDRTLLDALSESLVRGGYDKDIRLRSVSIGPHTLLRLTVPTDQRLLKAGDPIEYGLDVGNSELGLRSVEITPVCFRLLCTNGLRERSSGKIARMRHVGDPRRLEERLRGAIPRALGQARKHFELLRRAIDRPVPDVQEALGSLKRMGMNHFDIDAVRAQLVAPVPDDADEEIPKTARPVADFSVFDFVNAITASARLRASVSARLTGEEMGYVYLMQHAA